jgi:hypothetical protein
MRLECWVNGSLPSDPPVLAKLLGFGTDEVERALPQVSAFFAFDAGTVRCPELDSYRAHLEERRQRQSMGGKAGAAKTNKGRSGSTASGPTASPRAARGSLVQRSQAQSNREERLVSKGVDGEWVNDYDRQSRGY